MDVSSSESQELAHVKSVWATMQGKSPIYDFLLTKVDIIQAAPGVVKAHLRLDACHLNSKGGIHGAVVGAIVDWSGGLAICTHGHEKSGASVDIHISYLASASLGDDVEIEATANKVGGSLAFTTIKISKLVDGKPEKILVTASHTKYVRR